MNYLVHTIEIDVNGRGPCSHADHEQS